MIHFDNSCLHTESNENNRKIRKQDDRVLHQNNDNDRNATTNSTESVTDDNATIPSDHGNSVGEYDYYNSKDKRRWIEE